MILGNVLRSEKRRNEREKKKGTSRFFRKLCGLLQKCYLICLTQVKAHSEKRKKKKKKKHKNVHSRKEHKKSVGFLKPFLR